MAGQFETACHADIGEREEQQDRVAVFTREEVRLLVLADGLGGHADGGMAAQAVIDVAREQFQAPVEHPPVDLLSGIVRVAHERIQAMGVERRGSPHSTCVLLHIGESAAVWAHVGDSRLYRFKHGRLMGRTLDHSLVELLRLQGRIDGEQMKRHPDQGRLLEALGADRIPQPDTGERCVSAGDGFLLASDGLWGNVLDRELESVFTARCLPDALRDLVARAKGRGGSDCDNIAVAVARHAQARGWLFARLRHLLQRRADVT